VARSIRLLTSITLAVSIAGCTSRGSNSSARKSPTKDVETASIAMTFRDATSELGIAHVYENGSPAERNSIVESLGGGVALADTDRDGRLDLLFTGGGRFEGDTLVGLPSALFRRIGERQFRDVTAAAGLDAAGHYSHGIAAADVDNDGFTDLVVTGYGGMLYWRNRGDGTWVNATDASALNDDSWSSSAGWGDLDGDGFLDLYIAHYVNWSFENDPPCDGPSGVRDVCPPRAFDGLDDAVFLANGDGSFRNGTAECGLAKGGKGLGVVLVDLDLDLDLDVYVTNDTVNNFLYINDGKGSLHEQAMFSGTAVDDQANANGSMGVAVTDYDHNGLPDLFVANYEQELSAVYRNGGNANFLYTSPEAGLRALGTGFVGFGCVAGDVDLDGDQEIAIANGHVVHHPRNSPVRQKPLLLANESGVYRDISKSAGGYFTSPHAGRGLATGDLDRDGDLDLVFVNTREPAAVLLNETNAAGRSLVVKLVGVTSSRDGIGARAVLTTRKGEQVHFVAGGGSYLSTSDLTLQFGVPLDDELKQLEVYWPSGEVSRVAGEQLAFRSGSKRRSIVLVESRSATPTGGVLGLP
jgi:hypothetical protein